MDTSTLHLKDRWVENLFHHHPSLYLLKLVQGSKLPSRTVWERPLPTRQPSHHFEPYERTVASYLSHWETSWTDPMWVMNISAWPLVPIRQLIIACPLSLHVLCMPKSDPSSELMIQKADINSHLLPWEFPFPSQSDWNLALPKDTASPAVLSSQPFWFHTSQTLKPGKRVSLFLTPLFCF
jgi:hypothetical protein